MIYLDYQTTTPVAPELASSFLRVSFGPATSEADIDAFLAVWRSIAERQQRAA